MSRLAISVSVLPLLSISALFAHHGNSAYDETARVPIKGTVTEFVWSNPHSQIYLDVKDKSGKSVKWGVETNSPLLALVWKAQTRLALMPRAWMRLIIRWARAKQPSLT